MFGITPKISTDEKKIEELLARGVENIYPNAEFLKNKLAKGERLTIYLGIDPTNPTLHLGHVIPLIKLRQFQNLGHKIILLIGDFTAMIGDPTDKSATRKQLTREEVLRNMKEYKRQASKFILFSGSNAAELKFNSEWLSKMNFRDVLKLASLMTVEQMQKRDMFQRRNEEGRPVFIHEFMYPLMQGYDSVAMGVDGEVGGNDQTFNMLAGRDLMKALKNKEKFVLATKLLTDSGGSKMGKTEGNMVSLDQSPEDMFGKVMSWSDGLVLPAFEIITDVPLSEVKMENPKEAKMKLAGEIVKMCYGEKEAREAQEAFENTFSRGEFPGDARVIEAGREEKMADILVGNKIVDSKSEWRRLIDAGAISDYPDKKIKDPNEPVGEGERKIKIGKKTFVVLKGQ